VPVRMISAGWAPRAGARNPLTRVRTLSDAAFIPPPEHEMRAALGNPERFLHDSGGLDPLITCALAHAQFETIHPFLGGNGRMGRLLITFLLCHEKVLQRPVLYLSHYLKQHRASNYGRPDGGSLGG
jgi:Fic family protein